MYAYAWAILLLPLGGLAFSFVAETPRRAAQVCMGFMGAALVMALIVLGYRLAHETVSVTPNFSTLNFLSLNPDPSETTTFPATFQVTVGVRVDNLSASFMALIPVLVLAVQGLGTAMLERDAGYRRFFWASSLLAAAMIAVVASPGLFQLWLGLGVGTATTLVLALHWWHRSDTGAVARRAFMVLAGADVVLLLAMAFVVDKLGAFIGLETVPSSGAFDITDFRLLDPAWKAAAHWTVAGLGYRSLVIFTGLLVVAALVRAAQLPFTGWLSGLREAPLPVLGAISISLLGGVVLLARVYQLLMVTAHALSVVAVIGALTAVCLSAACLGAKDIYRLALLSASAQMALAITALGAGGYSDGLLIAFVSAPLGLLLLVTAGSLARAYRTREIASMSGAWRRMRRTSLSLGLWAVAAGGLDLVGYDVVSTVFLNHFPNGGHMAAWIQALVAVLAIVALLLTAVYAVRLVAKVCAGAPVARRGFAVERLAEAEPRLRALQGWSAAATVVAVLIGLPGIAGIGQGKGRVPALTFSRWIYFGSSHQALPLSGAALGVAAAVLLMGGAAGVAVTRLGGVRLWSRLRIPAVAAAAPAAVRWAARLGARAADTLAGEVVALDHGLVEPLYDSPGEGVETLAWSLNRVRVRRLRIGLGVALVIVLLLVGASVLAAGGHLPVHTT